MKVSYYPGCSLKGTAKDYQESVDGVCELFGVELAELDDWNCCGATAAHSLNHRASINLPGRNLMLAEAAGRDMLVPCPLCYNRLKTAERELTGGHRADYDVRIAGDKVHVWDLADFMAQDRFLKAMASRVKHKLAGIKAACYYGCMSSRPPKVTGENEYENPMSMDHILEQLGAEARPWSYKTDCCGASHLIARPDIVYTLVGRLYEEAHRAGANCIVVSCQMCQMNLDCHQTEIMKQIGAKYTLPVLYFTELIGLALGHRDTAKWLRRHFVDPIRFLRETCHLSLAA